MQLLEAIMNREGRLFDTQRTPAFQPDDRLANDLFILGRGGQRRRGRRGRGRQITDNKAHFNFVLLLGQPPLDILEMALQRETHGRFDHLPRIPLDHHVMLDLPFGEGVLDRFLSVEKPHRGWNQ